MRILALDTSTVIGSLALVSDDRTFESDLDTGETHSKTLVPEIQRLMDQAGLAIQDLEGFAVGLGPGSFTGLRIGLAAAKGLAWAAGKPLVGVPTLDALVAELVPDGRPAFPVLDARKGQFYGALYQPGPASGWEPCGPVTAFSEKDLEGMIGRPTWFIGPGLANWETILRNRLGSLFVRGPRNLDRVRALSIARIGKRLLNQGVETDPALVSPLYVRPPDIRVPKPR